MKIVKISLSNYKRLKHSHIRKIKWNIENPIQIILGSNGSGKSSLIKQATPIVPTKSEYSKNGIRKITISHQQHIFELISDFSNKTKAHSFLKDGIELNEGNGADVQRELIEKNFGLSQALIKCLTIDISWADLTPSARKNYVQQLNPINMDLLVNSLKTIRKTKTKLKNNLSLLKDREASIRSKMMDKKDFVRLRKRYKKNDKRYNDLIRFVTYIETLKNNITTSKKITVSDIETILKTIRKIRKNFPYYKVFETRMIRDLEYELSSHQHHLDNIVSNIATINQDLTQYRNYKKHSSEQNKIKYIENLLFKYRSTCDKCIEKLKEEYDFDLVEYLSKNDNQLIKSSVKKILEDWDRISKTLVYSCESIMNIIHDSDIHIIYDLDRGKVSKLERKIWELDGKSKELRQRIENHRSEYKEEKRSLEELKEHSIPDGCLENQLHSLCSLYKHHYENYTRLQKKVDVLEIAISRDEKKVKKLSLIVIKLRRLLSFYENIRKYREKMIQLFQEYPLIFNVIHLNFKNFSNIRFLVNRSNFIFTLIDTYFKELELYDQSRLENESLKKNSKYSTSFLDNIIKKQELTLKTLYDKKKTIEDKISNTSLVLKMIREVNSDIGFLVEEYSKIDDYIENIRKDKLRETYDIILEGTKDYISVVYSEKERLESILKEQDYLKNRLDQEILTISKKLKNDLKIVNKIEDIIKNIIMTSIIDFIHKWIDVTNIFLHKLCSYEFKIVKEDLNFSNLEFNYKLPIKVGDIKIVDISECSSGQKDILRLAMNMAILTVLNYRDYPIYIDEIDRTLDEYHKTRLLEFLKYLLDNQIVSQIFLVNHHATFYEAIIGDTIVLNSDNISCPSEYNTNIEIGF